MVENDQNNAQVGGEQTETGLGDGVRTFTQAELDRMLGERAARERAKYADYDALKVAQAELQTIKDAQKSELQRAQEAKEAAEKAATAAMSNANARLIQAEFIAAAALAGVAHPEDAYALADRTAIQMGDNGTVTGVTEQVKALVEAGRLVMQSGPRAPKLDGGAGSGQRSGDTVKLTPDEEAVALKMGMSFEEYAKYRPK